MPCPDKSAPEVQTRDLPSMEQRGPSGLMQHAFCLFLSAVHSTDGACSRLQIVCVITSSRPQIQMAPAAGFRLCA